MTAETDSRMRTKCLLSDLDKLPPEMRALVYWQSPVKSAIVMVAGLTILFSLGTMSMISVFAYLCLAIIICTSAWRIYYDTIGSKKSDEFVSPFGAWLSKDFGVPRDRVTECVNKTLDYASGSLDYLRHVLIVENYAETVKFGLYMYLLSIIGGFFNLITLVTVGFVLLFTVPKIYQLYQPQIDKVTNIVHDHINQAWNKVKPWLDKIPSMRKAKAN